MTKNIRILNCKKYTCFVQNVLILKNFHWQGLEHQKIWPEPSMHELIQADTDEAFHFFSCVAQEYTTNREMESLWNTQEKGFLSSNKFFVKI